MQTKFSYIAWNKYWVTQNFSHFKPFHKSFVPKEHSYILPVIHESLNIYGKTRRYFFECTTNYTSSKLSTIFTAMSEAKFCLYFYINKASTVPLEGLRPFYLQDNILSSVFVCLLLDPFYLVEPYFSALFLFWTFSNVMVLMKLMHIF